MKTTLIKKLKLSLLVVVVVDLIALIFKYPTIYLGAFTLGCSTHDLIALIFKYSIIYVAALTLGWSIYDIIELVVRPKH